MAGAAQSRIYRRFAWQACHLWYWVAPLGPDLAPGAPRHFAWQAWHNLTSTFVSRGRRGTISHLPSFCVAGVPLMVLGGALGPGFGAWGAAPLCVAGVAQSDIHLRFTWQSWHNLASTVVLRGRRATYGTGWRAWARIWRRGAAPLCVAGVAQSDIHLRFTWQAWHNLTSTVVLRGRRGTDHLSHTVTDHLSHTISHTPTLSHAIFHTQLCHTPTLSHTIFHTPTLSHTIFHTPLCHIPSLTHRFVTHHFVTHHLSHTIFHTPLCHIPSLTHRFATHHFVTHHIVTHHLSHIKLPHTIFHTPLCHIPSLTHRFVTHHFVTHHLSHTIFHTPLCHTPSFTHRHRPSFHTIFHTTLCPAPSFTIPSFTHHFVTHHLSPHHLSHTTLSHTIFHHTIFNTTLSHTPSFAKPSFTHHFVTHNFRTHHLAHTTLSHTHTIFLSHTPAFTYNFVTHNFVLLLGPSPPPLSFLLGRSCLVGLSGPLIFVFVGCEPRGSKKA